MVNLEQIKVAAFFNELEKIAGVSRELRRMAGILKKTTRSNLDPKIKLVDTAQGINEFLGALAKKSHKARSSLDRKIVRDNLIGKKKIEAAKQQIAHYKSLDKVTEKSHLVIPAKKEYLDSFLAFYPPVKRWH